MKKKQKYFIITACIFVLCLSSCHEIPKDSFLITSENGLEVTNVSPDVCCGTKAVISASLDPASIKILSWNILEGNRTSFFKNWKGDREKWKRDFIDLSEDSDIIVLQEVYLDPASKKNLDELEERKGKIWWAAAKSFIYKKNRVATGVMTLSFAEPVFACAIRDKEPYLRTPKTFLVTKYKLKGREAELLVGNFHGILVGMKTFMKQIENLKEQIGEHKGPVILAGDFNAYTRKRSDVLKKIVEELQLISVFDGFHAPDDRSTRGGYPLDHIFYRGLRLKNDPDVKEVKTSDHNPVKAEFKLAMEKVQ